MTTLYIGSSCLGQMLFLASMHVAIVSLLWCTQFMLHSNVTRLWLNIWMSVAWLLLCGLYVYEHCFRKVVPALRLPLLTKKNYKALTVSDDEP